LDQAEDLPKPFAAGIVSTENLEGLPAFSPDMTEFYFIRREGEMPSSYYSLRIKDGSPTIAEVETTDGPGEVFISHNGDIMHLGGEYRERTETGWSDLKSLDEKFDPFEIMRLTVSKNGMYVFDERDEYGLLRYSRLVEGKFSEPEAFPDHINSGTYTAHPFIAPDESYLIWDSERPDGFGSSDLYISFRQTDRSWGPAINMGAEINTPDEDIFGSVTSDGRYFVYDSVNLDVPRSNIFLVDAGFIEDLRAKNVDSSDSTGRPE
jgi:hypothetical protein